LRLIERMLKAGTWWEGRRLPTERGVPQGGVVSPTLSNILLTPFDWEMRRKGYQLTRYADDWVVTCSSYGQAKAALEAANRIMKQLGVELNLQKTRIVHVKHGFEFLGYKIKRGRRPMRLPPHMIKTGRKHGELYAYPRAKSVRRFKDRIRRLTRRLAPATTVQLIDKINPIVRGWGEHFKRAHVRDLFRRLDYWVLWRIRAHKAGRWRNSAWKTLTDVKLYEEFKLVKLYDLIPSITPPTRVSS